MVALSTLLASNIERFLKFNFYLSKVDKPSIPQQSLFGEDSGCTKRFLHDKLAMGQLPASSLSCGLSCDGFETAKKPMIGKFAHCMGEIFEVKFGVTFGYGDQASRESDRCLQYVRLVKALCLHHSTFWIFSGVFRSNLIVASRRCPGMLGDPIYSFDRNKANH